MCGSHAPEQIPTASSRENVDTEWETRPYQQLLDSASEKSKAMTGDVCTNVLVESGYCGKHQGKVVGQAIFELLWATQLSFWVSSLV